MKKIVIYQDREVDGKKVRTILRSISPSPSWQGYSRSGTVIDSEARDLARTLEPSFTGFFIS